VTTPEEFTPEESADAGAFAGSMVGAVPGALPPPDPGETQDDAIDRHFTNASPADRAANSKVFRDLVMARARASFQGIGPRVGANSVWEAEPLPTNDYSALDSVIATYEKIGINSVEAERILGTDWLLLVSPEIITGLRPQMAGALDTGFDREVLEQLSGVTVIPEEDGPTVEADLMADGGLTADFLQAHRWDFKGDERLMLLTLFSALRADYRPQVVALAEQHLLANPLVTEEDRARFLLFVDDKARTAQQQYLKNKEGIGHFFHQTRKPLEFVADKLWKPFYLPLMTGPDEYKWREPLSFGQNVSLQLGVTPDEGLWWEISSGMWDVPMTWMADPLNWAFGLGSGARTARGIAGSPQLMNMIARQGRGVTALRASMPFWGRGVTRLRGPMRRAGFVMQAKHMDDVLDAMVGAGVIDEIHAMAKAARAAGEHGNVRGLVENWPQLKKTLGGLTDFLTSDAIIAGGPEYIKDVFRLAATGGSKKGGGIIQLLEKNLDNARTEHHRMVREALENGTVTPRTSIKGREGFDGNELYEVVVNGKVIEAWDDAARGTELVGATLRQVGSEASEKAVVVLGGGKPNSILDIADPEMLKGLAEWLGTHPAWAQRLPSAAGGPTRSGLEALTGFLSGLGRKGRIDHFDAQALQRLIAADGDVLTLLSRYAEVRGFDLIGTADEMFLTANGARRAIRATDGYLPTVADRFVQSRFRFWQAERFFKDAAGAHEELWHLADMPVKIPNQLALKLKPWRSFGSGRNQYWRRIRASMFGPGSDGEISMTKVREGMDSLGSLLARMRMAADDIKPILNDFAAADPFARRDIALDAILKAADHPMFRNPFIKHHIIQFYRSAGEQSFAKLGAEGAELGMGLTGKAKALLPEHLTASLALPGNRELFRAARRFGRASGAKNPIARSWYRGWNNIGDKSARVKRKQLVEQFRGMLHREFGGGPEATRKIAELGGEGYLEALAYGSSFKAATTGMIDGFGLFAQLGNGLNSMRKFGFRLFAVSQLSLNPLSWAMRVIVLEEGWRAAMLELPSMYKNPARWGMLVNDAVLINRVEKWRKSSVAAVHNLVGDIMRPLTKGDSATRVLKRIDEFLPGFRDSIKDPLKVKDWETALGRYLVKEVTNAGNMGVLNPNLGRLGMGAWGTRRAQTGIRRMEKLNLPSHFVWDDASEIIHKGPMMEYASHSGSLVKAVQWSAQTGPDGRYAAGTAYAGILSSSVHSPLTGRFALNRIIQKAGHGQVTHDARRLLSEDSWRLLHRNIKEAAEVKGVNPAILEDPLRLAQWYLDEVLDPYALSIYGRLWDNAPIGPEAIRIAESILRDKTAKLADGMTLDFQRSNLRNLTEKVRIFAERRAGIEDALPPHMTFHLDHRFLSEGGEEVTNIVRRASNFILAKAGDSFSQKMNRRPAWLATYNQKFLAYTDSGISAAVARKMAAHDASELVNFVFYNTDDSTAMLRQMNGIIPYFQAQWEVAQTWAYKIPMMSGGLVGYPMMVRKIDRTLDALTNMGVLTWEGDPVPGSPWKTRTGRLHLTNGGERVPNAFGRLASRVAANLYQTPLNGVGHLFDLLNWEHDFTDKNNITLTMGNPLDITSGGIGAVNQGYQFGVDPIVGIGLKQALSRLHEAVDFRKEPMLPGESLQDFADRLGLNASELIFDNRAQLEDDNVLGKDILEQFDRSFLAPDQLFLKEDIDLKIPQTSLWTTLIENLALPYGTESSLAGTLTDFIPNPIERMFVQFGMHPGVMTPNGNENDDAILNGLRQLGWSKTTHSQFASECKTAVAHLEVTDVIGDKGLLTRLLEKQREIGVFRERYHDEINDQATLGLPRSIDGTTETGQALNRLVEDIERLEAELVTRASNIAYGAMFGRHFLGFLSPGTPTMRNNEQMMMEEYWYGNNLIRAKEEGKAAYDVPLPAPVSRDGREHSLGNFNAMLGEWLRLDPNLAPDGKASQMRNWVKTNVPDLWPLTFGASYWGPAGEPPLDLGQDEWAKDVAEGKRLPMPEIAFIHRMAINDVTREHERRIVDLFGNDPISQVQGMLTNRVADREENQRYRLELSNLEWWDDNFQDGAYHDWRKRNTDNQFVEYDEAEAYITNILSAIDDLTAPNANLLLLSPQDRATQVAHLQTASRKLNENLNSWKESYGPNLERRPRDVLKAAYYEQVMTPYWDENNRLFEELGQTTNSHDASLIYDKLTLLNNTVGMKEAYIGGFKVPSPLDWSWNGKDEEKRELAVRQWAASPIAWLSHWEAKHMEEAYPQLGEYLPTTAAEWHTYEAHGAIRDMITQRSEPDAQGNVELNNSEHNQMMKAADLWLENQLVDQGRTAEMQYEKMSPLQRLSKMGVLSPALDAYVPEVNTILDALEAMEKGVLTNEGRSLFGIVQGQIVASMETQPGLWQEIQELGFSIYNEQYLNAIIMRLFAGSDSEYGEL